MKFWAALILGTIGISAFVTYLNLFKEAQTLEVAPLPPKTEPPLIEFGDLLPRKDNVEVKQEISANVLLVQMGTTYLNEEQEVGIKLNNVGKGPLELTLLTKSCGCSRVLFNDKEVTNTDHTVKIEPGGGGILRLTWKPEKRDVMVGPQESFRIRATFVHNDERYSDNLHFEVSTVVKTKR